LPHTPERPESLANATLARATAPLAHPDLQGTMAWMVNQEARDNQENLDNRELLEQSLLHLDAKSAQLETKANQDPLDPTDHLDQMATQDQEETMEPLVDLDHEDRLDLLVLLDQTEKVDQRVHPDNQEILVAKELLDQRDRQAKLVDLVQPEDQDPRATTENQAVKGHKDLRVDLEPTVNLEIQEDPDSPVPLAQTPTTALAHDEPVAPSWPSRRFDERDNTIQLLTHLLLHFSFWLCTVSS